MVNFNITCTVFISSCFRLLSVSKQTRDPQDIRYQRRYRQRRKAELVKLQQTLTALKSKTTFYQDQMDDYDTYIKACLDNLNRKQVFFNLSEQLRCI